MFKPEYQVAEASWKYMRLSNPVLRGLVRAEAAQVSLLLSIPRVDACSFLQKWAATGYSTRRIPPLISGFSFTVLSVKIKTLSKVINRGVAYAGKRGLSAA